MLLLQKFTELYTLVFDELIDSRTKPWFLVARPYQIGTVLALYLMFVLKWGPNWMKNRPAFNLDKVLIVYNAAQVLASLYIFVNGIYYAWGWKYKWICEPVDYSNKPDAITVAWLTYLYFLTKVVDLLDTVFFVLRKKFNQVSFLHIYHHTGMVLLIWGATNYFAGGHGSLVGVINSFVHVIMYSYYLLTVVSPSAKKSFWWKKHITQLQILQFFWCVIHMGVIVFKPDCAYPRWTTALFLPQNLFILILFLDFYIKTYVRKPKEPKNPPTVINGPPKFDINGNKNGIVSCLNCDGHKCGANEFVCLKTVELKNLKNNIMNYVNEKESIMINHMGCNDEIGNKMYDFNSLDKKNG